MARKKKTKRRRRSGDRRGGRVKAALGSELDLLMAELDSYVPSAPTVKVRWDRLALAGGGILLLWALLRRK